jgi:hypothetical protein
MGEGGGGGASDARSAAARGETTKTATARRPRPRGLTFVSRARASSKNAVRRGTRGGRATPRDALARGSAMDGARVVAIARLDAVR